MYIIFGNYGNQTLAVCQWAAQQKLSPVTVISIDTGFADAEWNSHVVKAEAWVKSLNFQTVRLKSVTSFPDLMRDRQGFPSTKFQWCAGFLKGLALLQWLDDHDPRCEATLILGKRRLDSRAQFNLPEHIEADAHYGDRKVWHPLFNCSDHDFLELLHQTGFKPFNHRSLECDPCVNSDADDLSRLASTSIERLDHLEKELQKTMFVKPIREMVKSIDKLQVKNDINLHDKFNMGCGSPYACGE